MPLISICIPTYKRLQFLRRLLDSIAVQSFKDFEVVITDDSPDNIVQNLCEEYKHLFAIFYSKNAVPLGTPKNWNEAIRRSKGEWIKLMHDDDWFAERGALTEFAHALQRNASISFFYSAYINVFENGEEKTVYASSLRRKNLLQNPATLFSKNIIGPPSVTLVRNDGTHWYDERMKWVVDIDYYIRYLRDARPFYIDVPLIKVGIHQNQVTQESFRVATVEIPENFELLNKVGVQNLKNILIYDAWWRLLRNLRITSLSQIRESGYDGHVNGAIQSMVSWQSRLPWRILKMGWFSKMVMFLHYSINRSALK